LPQHRHTARVAQDVSDVQRLLFLDRLGGDDLGVARLMAQGQAVAVRGGRLTHQHAGFRLVAPCGHDDIVDDDQAPLHRRNDGQTRSADDCPDRIRRRSRTAHGP